MIHAFVYVLFLDFGRAALQPIPAIGMCSHLTDLVIGICRESEETGEDLCMTSANIIRL